MATIYMLCGLPGSGKSTLAEEYVRKYDAAVFSVDALCEERYGLEIIALSNRKRQALFAELHRRIKACLAAGGNAVYDATNTKRTLRMGFLSYIKDVPCKKVAVIVATPYKKCLALQREKGCPVPEDYVKAMYEHFQLPYYYEGWDSIYIRYFPHSTENSFGTPENWVELHKDFDQGTVHHSKSLGGHCRACAAQIEEFFREAPEKFPSCISYKDFHAAAMLHDCGKPFCKKIDPETGEFHYYYHEHVGAYMSLFFSGIKDHLLAAQVIEWHMNPYVAWKHSEEKMEQDRKLIGESLYQLVSIIHEADKMAH